uniref:Uncharacterized protein n=1 Tax=Pyxicephalus adspersus TaxID=30357 RepID=A0AAV3AZ88_PYXAD|nr:TPA: hypothetical protein GDO54_008053 [Pyxicephalus adspersus]
MILRDVWIQCYKTTAQCTFAYISLHRVVCGYNRKYFFSICNVDHKTLFPCSKDKALSCTSEISHLLCAFVCTQVWGHFVCCSHVY